MNIKKIGHCCLIIKTNNLTIMTDPGSYSIPGQTEETGIDLILITHEHGDHLHIESLKKVLEKNPEAKVITNMAVGKKLNAEGIPFEVLEGTASTDFKGITIEASDGKHEEIFEQQGQVQNTGYFIDGKLFYPGDSFHNPGKPVSVLALPVAGPWCKIGDAIRYAISLKASYAFPVHDGLLKQESIKWFYEMIAGILKGKGVEFIPMGEEDEHEFK